MPNKCDALCKSRASLPENQHRSYQFPAVGFPALLSFSSSWSVSFLLINFDSSPNIHISHRFPSNHILTKQGCFDGEGFGAETPMTPQPLGNARSSLSRDLSQDRPPYKRPLESHTAVGWERLSIAARPLAHHR